MAPAELVVCVDERDAIEVENRARALAVPVTPVAAAALERAGIPYSAPEEH